jgi:N-acyl-D-amino-acid deacylase
MRASGPAQRATLLRGGSVVDGSGVSPFLGDVVVRGDRIAEVTPHGARPTGPFDLEIDASGLLVCPGFIDVHTHDDLAVLRDGTLAYKVSQGVTTVVLGNCGFGAAPLVPASRADVEGRAGISAAVLGTVEKADWRTFGEYLQRVEAAQPAPNVAILAAHNAIRIAVCGPAPRPATRRETDQMLDLLEGILAEGAIGLSTGLIYPPGSAAETVELVALAQVVREAGARYVTHMRDEADRLEQAVQEVLTIRDKAGVTVHISHLKAAGRANWGKLSPVLDSLAPYPDVTTDVYPYVAASTSLTQALTAGGEATPTRPEDVLLAYVPNQPDLEGRTLAAVSQSMGRDAHELAGELISRPGGASVVYFVMDEKDLVDALRFERTMIGSDGLPTLQGKPHPRLFGAFPRFLRRYSLDQDILPVEEAVRRMTSLPCDTFGLRGRGRIRSGEYADLVVIDPRTLEDHATYEDPQRISSGIEWVMVNGAVVWRAGRALTERPGRILRHGRTEAAQTEATGRPGGDA